MTTWELIAERAKELPPDKQREVLDFVDFIRTRHQGPTAPLRDPEGLWKGVDVSAEDLDAARREL